MNQFSLKVLALGLLVSSCGFVVAGDLVDSMNLDQLDETTNALDTAFAFVTSAKPASRAQQALTAVKTSVNNVKNGYKKAYNAVRSADDNQALCDGIANGTIKAEDLTAKQRNTITNAFGNGSSINSAKEYAIDAKDFVAKQANNALTYSQANKSKVAMITAGTVALIAAVCVANQKGYFDKPKALVQSAFAATKATIKEYKKSVAALIAAGVTAGTFGLGLYLNKTIAA